jgi:predicted nucleic acid-binding protein
VRRYLVDTSLLAAYLRRRTVAIQLISPWIANEEAATSILVYGEVLEYLKGFPNYAEHRRDLRDLLNEIRPYFVTSAIVERYAEIRRQMRPGVGLIGDIDTLIAATALQRDLTIVTTDRDFLRVPGVRAQVIDRDHLRPRRP